MPKMYGLEPEHGPCDCLVAMEDYPHTIAEHHRASCNGSYNGYCGGCYDCMSMQVAYAKEQEYLRGYYGPGFEINHYRYGPVAATVEVQYTTFAVKHPDVFWDWKPWQK